MAETGSRPDEIEERVLALLRGVALAPDGPDVIAAGQVYDVVATAGAVRVLLDRERLPEGADEALAEAVTPLLRALPGVTRVVLKPRPRSIAARPSLPGIGRVVAVHGGKGGVGKSTVAVNLAVALAHAGLRVGLLDADVYGPSAPALLGLSGRATPSADGRKIAPMSAHGIAVMSLGFLMPEGKALAWRGGLVDEGLPQLFADVAWGELDMLLIDLPPGTSDVHLAVAREVALGGVIVVTAPGQIAVQDVQRGMEMFADLAVPGLGIVETMAGVPCRRCGATRALFGTGGGAQLAAETGLPLLACIPFLPELAAAGAQGRPVLCSAPESEAARLFTGLARQVMELLPPPPEDEVRAWTSTAAVPTA